MAVQFGRSVSDIHETLSALEVGMMLTRYSRSRRPETRMFRVMLETRELVWSRNAGGKPEGIGMFRLQQVVKCMVDQWRTRLLTLFGMHDAFAAVNTAAIALKMTVMAVSHACHRCR